jgi:hypothetical protein
VSKKVRNSPKILKTNPAIAAELFLLAPIPEKTVPSKDMNRSSTTSSKATYEYSNVAIKPKSYSAITVEITPRIRPTMPNPVPEEFV